MKVWLIQFWETLRASYWFIPSVMVLAASLLAELAIRSEDLLDLAWLREVGWLYLNQPAGARELLSTVAGSMITVAGVTFSMTIVAISHASSQIGPRLLTDFMRDRGNQITLGTFIATFIYCLLVLRTVRAADPGTGEEALAAFVPQLALLIALALAITSVGVLIFFIHHVPASLSVTNLIHRVSGTLLERIECLYPEQLGSDPSDQTETEERGEPSDVFFGGPRSGYVAYTDDEALMSVAVEEDLVIELLARPGAFLCRGTPLARVFGGDELDEAVQARLCNSFVLEAERTPRQDVLFPALELVEVAVRALSPGVNDPYTAIRCIDRLKAAMIELSHRKIPDPRRTDEDDRVRVIARPVDFDEFVRTLVDGLRPHVKTSPACSAHLIRALLDVAAALPPGMETKGLESHAAAVRAAAAETLTDPLDLAGLREAMEPASKSSYPEV